jgi:hypothetical protein
MKTLEQWFLRIADGDFTWFGLNWLRPAKQRRIVRGYIILSRFLIGLPGMAVGMGLILFFIGQIEPILWLSIFALVMIVELPLNILCACFWNQRIDRLARDIPTA